ncbi:hypothetical protein KIH39_20060 [Telmatocola sphagniphila]|uniref:Uncharacterized protein n=1 Tax=Telmatocola sphagniphila TaxID=1123043 RepID=A0A8E6B383_9BACT|nr:hypothetical protein [Telmatocola sphagniphila]QVL31123.1 hypothetical protein KIH39_20060 [Telmatocola sphagniphila]
MSKKPKIAQSPAPPSPRLGNENPEEFRDQTPVWSISIFDHQGPWGKHLCEQKDHLWDEIYPKLRNYESMTWNEILQNSKRDHSIEVYKLIKLAQKRLVELRLDDYDNLFRFRLSGEMRVWGIREGRVFRLLWWDPEHEICPSIKKHT